MTWAMDELEARARAQLGTLADFGDRLGSLSVRQTSDDDLITVEVDGTGALTGLWFADGANELGASRLGDQIVATAALAAQRVFARRAALTEEFTTAFGEQLGIGPTGA
ncbi:YbaB/EbfC family DNA-binding protein [Gordonia sp. NPDC003425]